jgi:hypothetical protein
MAKPTRSNALSAQSLAPETGLDAPQSQKGSQKGSNSTKRGVGPTAKKRTTSNLTETEGDGLPALPLPKGKKARRRSASPFPEPDRPRVRTNEHPGLIVKRTRRTPAEVQAAKAAKVAKTAAAAEDSERTIQVLAEVELEQAAMEADRREKTVRRRAARGKAVDITADSNNTNAMEVNRRSDGAPEMVNGDDEESSELGNAETGTNSKVPVSVLL